MMGIGCEKFEQTWEPAQTALVENQQFTIAAGDSFLIGRIAFGGTGATRNHEFAGSFVASQPTKLIILEQFELLEFQAGRPYETTWESGLTISASWDFPVEPNGYHFIVDHREGRTEVIVDATIIFRQEELVNVTRM